MREVQKETIAEFLRRKRASTSTATAKLNHRILTGFFSYCKNNDVVADSPMPSSNALKLNAETAKSIRRAFTVVEIQTLLKKSPTNFWRYMILAGFYAGQRLGDLATLSWSAVDFQDNVIRLKQRKTGRPVTIPMHRELSDFLSHLRRNASHVKAGDAIFPEAAERYIKHGAGMLSNEFYDECLVPCGLATRRSHKKIVNGDGHEGNGSREVSALSFHCLRHSFVTLLKVTGASMPVARELAGHSSNEISDIYTHMPVQTLSAAVDRLPALTSGKTIEV
jgi:integrase